MGHRIWICWWNTVVTPSTRKNICIKSDSTTSNIAGK